MLDGEKNWAIVKSGEIMEISGYFCIKSGRYNHIPALNDNKLVTV